MKGTRTRRLLDSLVCSLTHFLAEQIASGRSSTDRPTSSSADCAKVHYLLARVCRYVKQTDSARMGMVNVRFELVAKGERSRLGDDEPCKYLGARVRRTE